jgi:hypothetical protein
MTGSNYGAYVIDSWQRAILYADAMRRRGNQFIEHYQAGKPPVLVFEHDVVMDGADLDRPCNYLLLKIKPDPKVPTDPKKRPFVIFDPRAGHGPGIGGSKEASQVGVALRAGHPVYFVSFRPDPVPHQTLADVANAEWHFLEKVKALHPDCTVKPAIVGNCQAGWAIMMLSSYDPDQASVIGIAGTPLSYWSGVEGKNPMRYAGGLAGGAWLASLLSDAGAGIMDGAYLVENFENQNPANTHIGKPYNLYSKIDTEVQRFLDFERWWGGHFLLTAEEMRAITGELFVGNKLTAGRILAQDGTPLDLRRIKAPIVVVCSHGDNITPPQQALNWILDLYDDVEQIRANEQTIVYTVHDSVGHLGIFVSAKVALKEHAEFVDSIELIEALAPGLYEMVIEEVRLEDEGKAAEHLEYNVRFEARTLDAIKALDDGREDERPFTTVARMSEINDSLYETFVGPWVRAMANQPMAEAMRLMHPSRQAYLRWSDWNPWMKGVAVLAEQVRENRAALPADDPFRAAERQMVDRAIAMVEAWAGMRDKGQEALFKAIWDNPVMRAVAGETTPSADVNKPAISRDRAFRDLAALKLKALEARETHGSFAEAVMRVVYAATKAAGVVDARGFRAALEVRESHPRLAGITPEALRAEAKEAALMVMLDEDGALANLPKLLPTAADRKDALDICRQIVSWRQDVPPEVEALMERVELILGEAPKGKAQGAEVVEQLAVAAKPVDETPADGAAAQQPAKTALSVVQTPRRAPAPRRPAKRRAPKTSQ